MKKSEKTLNQRAAQSQHTRQRLLDASLELFVYKGYGSTTVRDITTKAGVSPGLMFHYFSSKQEILKEHITFMNAGISSVTQMLLDSGEHDALKTFSTVAQMILESFEDAKGKQLFLLSNQIATSTVIAPETKKLLLLSSSMDASASLIARGQQAGVIRAGAPYALVLTFWGALQGVAELLVWHPKASHPEAAHLVAVFDPRLQEGAKF